MANISSDKAFFSIVDTGASVRTLSADIVSIEGLPGPRELLDSTTLGVTGHTHHPTLENIRFTIEFLYNDTASTGSAAVINALRTHTAATAFVFGPKGSASGAEKFSGDCWVADVSNPIRIGSLVGIRAEFRVNGAVTRGTFA